MKILTALPERLRRVLEQLSGYDLRDVRVYSASRWPARIGARAFALGSDIHLSPGAEDALEHEAWHVIQQKQGRVPITRSSCLESHAGLNDDASLEREADTMGLVARHLALRDADLPVTRPLQLVTAQHPVVQRQITVSGLEVANAATLETEIKNRLYLVASDVVDFSNIVKDMLDERLVFDTWADVKREVLVREVGYQAVEKMRALAVDHANRFTTAETRFKKEITAARRDKTKKVDKVFSDNLEQKIYDEEGLIRWGNASYLTYKCRERPMFQWLSGTRNNDPLVMNCWEAVLYSLVKTGLVDKSYITWCIRPAESNANDLPGLGSPNNLAASMLRNMDFFYWPSGAVCNMARKEKRVAPPQDEKSPIVKIPKDKVIPKGRVLMFGLNEHVALSTGTLRNGKHGILELDGSTNTIQESTIEGLKGTYLTSMVVAPFPLCPSGSVRVVEEDNDKSQKRLDMKAAINREYQQKKDKAEELTQKKIAELEKQKEFPGNLQFEKEINEVIEAQRKACTQECARLDQEASEKFEREWVRWNETRTPPVLATITFQHRANDPYEGEVPFL
ncbi:DUF4157 domain-containing protein [Pyxidicoccus parkwayensis]|uniref:DUF4157 domain-containing protein n=1 Tax=Pyxidicoccus parkwayensis TaxID=2813578 RepID=A0ABX7P7D3_9BACT|nr:DUF4157 domain-containing protein [Pyxidicoccus parkwaysis]QSQ26375.1 DUF4157 domain-containing protein [Pyxidicoccus parkwaysis]